MAACPTIIIKWDTKRHIRFYEAAGVNAPGCPLVAKLVSRAALALSLVCLTSPALAGTLIDKPLPPTLLAEGEVGRNRLDWIPPPASPGAPITGYNVYRLNGTHQERLDHLPAGQTTYFDADVSPDYVYTYFVTSQSSDGESAPSNLGTAYPRCNPVSPAGEVDSSCIYPPEPPGGPYGLTIRP